MQITLSFCSSFQIYITTSSLCYLWEIVIKATNNPGLGSEFRIWLCLFLSHLIVCIRYTVSYPILMLRTKLNLNTLQWNALHCTELHCITLTTTLHCTASCLTALHYTSLQGSTLNYNKLYLLFWTFRHDNGKLMAKEAIYTLGLITFAVFVQVKGKSFQKSFYECN